MELFEAYDKYVKPEDDAAAAALAEAAKKSDDQLWDDNQSPIEDRKVVDQPGDQNTNVSRETLSQLTDDDVNRIATRLAELMGQKGGNDGDNGSC